ncbi:MAG: hypothetical protein E7456_02055 [Ruminococcaceae bacterium]|nr:hypothetical protein [Oscillospiraceae bacterium]
MRELFDKVYNWLRSDGILQWVAIICAFYVFWPAGVAAVLFKFGVLTPDIFDGHKTNTVDTQNSEYRKAEYKRIARGMSSVSIDYLANALSVDFNVVMRDVQEMVIDGAFGSQAYIDYGLRRLFIKADEAEAQPVQKKAAKTEKTTSSTAKTQPKTGKKKKDKIKEIFGSGNGLLVWGIIIGVLGFGLSVSAMDTIVAYLGSVTFAMVWELITALCILAAGCVLLGVRSGRKKRVRRIAVYLSYIGTKSSVTISELANASGAKSSTVKKDIEVMLEKKLLGEEAYLNVGAGRLIIRQEEQKEAEAAVDPKDRYHAIIMEIRQLNDEIADPMVSEKIDQIERLTAKIFKVVQEKPEKLPEIKSFMSYYLPTTLKLLRSYRDLENQGVSGANIDATKERIEKILDTLISGFSQQLDQLFKSDAMDISSDIDVLETMMRRDGLSKDESGFQIGL